MQTIRNPGEWTAEAFASTTRHLGGVGRALAGDERAPEARIRTITPADLREALAGGWEDFRTCRSDVIFLVFVYPLAGLLAVGFASSAALLPLLFPAVAGLALMGPVAAVGLYELSRRRERGETPSWLDAFAPVASPSFGAIFLLTLAMAALFLVWIATAQAIYAATLGPQPPASLAAFAADVIGTQAGWAMIVIGFAVGFGFAAVALSAAAFSFPLLLDRQVGLVRAVMTSVAVAQANPRTMALWGVIVAGTLALACVPFFLGLIVAMPVLGHATWRLYRKAVA